MLVQQSIGSDLDFFIHVFHFLHLLVVLSLFEVHPSGMWNKLKLLRKQLRVWAVRPPQRCDRRTERIRM